MIRLRPGVGLTLLRTLLLQVLPPPSGGCPYNGSVVAEVVATGHNWSELSTTVNVVDEACTALQLRASPQHPKFGATVWIDDVSVVPLPSSSDVNGNGWHAAYFDDGLETAAHVLKADDALSSPSIVGASVAIVWASSPVLPGETALLQIVHRADAAACAAAPDATVCVAGTATCATVAALVNDTAASFTVPATFRLARYTATLCGASVELNALEPWWVQGDRGNATSSGGGVRVAGRALAFDKHGATCVNASTPLTGAETGVSARLRPADSAAAVPLQVVSASCYDVVAKLPQHIAAGPHTVDIRNSLSAEWTAAGQLAVAAPDSFPARSWYLNQGDNLTQTLKVAQVAGGGTITLASGADFAAPRHIPLVVGHRTRLVGAAAGGKPRIVWSGAVRGQDAGDDQPLLSLRGTFELRGVELALNGNAGVAGIPAIAVADGSEGGIIADVSMSHNQLQPAASDRIANALYIGRARGFRVLDSSFSTRGADLSATSKVCSLEWSHQNVLHLQMAEFGLILRSNFSSQCSGWSAASSHSLIFDGNVFAGTGLSRTGGSGSNALGAWHGAKPSGLRLAFLRNRVTENPEALVRSETFTTDGGFSAYYNKTAGSDGDSVRLIAPLTPFHGTDWVTGIFAVVSGTGKGQLAEVVANKGLEIQLAHPLAVPLDATSVVTVAPNCGQGIIAGNSYTGGTSLQLYGGNRYVLAHNSLAQMRGSKKIPGGGIRILGLVYDDEGIVPAHLPLMRVELVGNSLADTNGIGVHGCDVCDLPFAICNPSCPVGTDLAQGVVIRGNTIARTHVCELQHWRDVCANKVIDCYCQGISIQEKLLGAVVEGNSLDGNSSIVVSTDAAGVYVLH